MDNPQQFLDDLKQKLANAVLEMVGEDYYVPSNKKLTKEQQKEALRQKLLEQIPMGGPPSEIEAKQKIYFETIVDVMGNSLYDPQNQLLPRKVQLDRIKRELNANVNLKGMLEKIEKAFTYIKEKLPPQKDGAVSEEKEEENPDESEEDKKTMTLQKEFKIPQKNIEGIYKMGYEAFENKDYENASNVLYLVATLAGNVYEYWMAYASSLMALGDVENALKTFVVAMLMNDENPEPHLWAARCYLILKNAPDAKIEMEIAEELLKLGSPQEEQTEQLKQLQEDLKAA